MSTPITLFVGEEEITFDASIQIYESFINDVEPKNKIVPMKRFLKTCVIPDDRQKLDTCLSAGLAPDLCTALIKALTPQVEISVKK